MTATVRTGAVDDAGRAAALHASEIAEGFLATLGPRFLARLYRRVVRCPGSFLLVAEVDGEMAGFAAGTEDTSRLYRSFLWRDGPVAAALAAPALVREWRKVVETLRYPAAGADLPAAELLSLAVAPAHRGQGVGRGLTTAVLAELQRREVEDARVVVASTNVAALRVYRAAGFRRTADVQVHAGARSEVLTWP